MEEESGARDLALFSLVLGLVFWVPLINMFTSPPSLFFGVKSIHFMVKNRQHYSRRHLVMACIGVLLSGIALVFGAIGLLMNSPLVAAAR